MSMLTLCSASGSVTCGLVHPRTAQHTWGDASVCRGVVQSIRSDQDLFVVKPSRSTTGIHLSRVSRDYAAAAADTRQVDPQAAAVLYSQKRNGLLQVRNKYLD